MPTSDYHTGKPRTTSNTNVPSDARIIGEAFDAAGNLTMTYYCQHYDPPRHGWGRWALWKVGVAAGDEPEPTCGVDMSKAGVLEEGRTFMPPRPLGMSYR